MTLRRMLVDEIIRRRRVDGLHGWDVSVPDRVKVSAERVKVFAELLDADFRDVSRIADDVSQHLGQMVLTSQSDDWLYLLAEVSGVELEIRTVSATGWCAACSDWRCAHRLAFWIGLAWHCHETRWAVERPLWELVLLPFADDAPSSTGAAAGASDERHAGWVRYTIHWPPDLDEPRAVLSRHLMRRSKSTGKPLKPMKMPQKWDVASARVKGLLGVDEEVHAVVERLEALEETATLTRSYRMSTMVDDLGRQGLSEIFTLLTRCTDVRLDGERVKVSKDTVTPVMKAGSTPDGGLALRWEPKWDAVIDAGPGYVLIDGVLHPLAESTARLRALVIQPLPFIPRSEVAGFISGFVLRAPVRLELDGVGPKSTPLSGELGVEAADRVRARLILGETLDALTVDVRFAYYLNDASVEIGPDDRTPLLAVDSIGGELRGVTALIRRRSSWERAMLDDLELAMGKRAVPAELEGVEAYDFLVDGLPRLSASWEVFGEASLKLHKVSGAITQSVSVKTGIDWFDIDVRFAAGKAVLPVRDVLASWLEGKRYHRLDDGTVARLPRRWLAQHGDALGELEDLAKASKRRLGAWATPLAETLLAIAEAGPKGSAKKTGLAAWRATGKALNELAVVGVEGGSGPLVDAYPVPSTVKAELRDYQVSGYRWMMFLRDHGLGGILADDMGLGKTMQTLAALAATHLGRGASEHAKRPSLVVAPASVVHHWAREAARFVPRLKVTVHHGTGRETELKRGRSDGGPYYPGKPNLIVTSYALMRLDVATLGQLEYAWLILDEAQNIKNPHSKVTQAARSLHAAHKIALSGTPVENNLFELWSLFHFLMPGFFGPKESFGRRYARRIHKYQDPEALDGLRARIKPFVLRRLKSEVATELPPRTEVVLYCDLPPAQMELYEQVKRTYRDSVMKRVKDEGMGKNTLMVLEALMRLRQAACDPRLLPFEEARQVTDSGKLTLLFERLEIMLESEHKALIFSQWPSLLRLVAEGLESRDVPYFMLHGGTPTAKRPAMVDAFNADDGPPVFLISLKAGGTGLTLTAADHVIHLDPWWNPAVEAQATDRAHRIGQDKPVVAYKIVARGTVEERILELQDRKRALFEATVDADRMLVSQLTADDLARVFE